MVNFCIITALGNLYLFAYSQNIIRFSHKPSSSELKDNYRWYYENSGSETTRICNAQYKTCISVGANRSIDQFEVLVLEEPNHGYQDWVVNNKTGIVRSTEKNAFDYYFNWDVIHKDGNFEPLQIDWARFDDEIDKFRFAGC